MPKEKIKLLDTTAEIDIPEIKLVVQQFHSVTRSFSRKVQIKQFEPMDLFSSHNENIPLEEATPDKIAEVSARLYSMAKEDVERDIKNYMNAPADGALTSEDLDGVAVHIKAIASGIPKDDINKAIVAVKDKLNERQLQFLRNVLKTL